MGTNPINEVDSCLDLFEKHLEGRFERWSDCFRHG
jgi:hypothetical protein